MYDIIRSRATYHGATRGYDACYAQNNGHQYAYRVSWVRLGYRANFVGLGHGELGWVRLLSELGWVRLQGELG